MENVAPFSNFESSSRAVLAFLSDRIGFDLWMMTKTDGDKWIILQTEDHGYNVGEGSVFRWTDSFCSRMVDGKGPRIAPQSQNIPAYANAPIAQQVPINAYIGVPVTHADGSLFGTLCAIHPEPKPESIAEELPLIELQAKFLGTILDSEKNATKSAELLNICRQEASTDPLTKLQNRRGWDKSIAIEETRVQRYGGMLSVFIVDIDDLKKLNDTKGHAEGDALIRRTADCLRAVLRGSDVIARTGGDEFAILTIASDHTVAKRLFSKINEALSNAQIKASVGMSTRTANGSLKSAIDQADLNMYAAKAIRKK